MTRNCQIVPLVTYFGIRIIKPVSDLTLFTEPSQRIHCCFDDSEVKEKLASGVVIFFSGHLNIKLPPDVKNFKL